MPNTKSVSIKPCAGRFSYLRRYQFSSSAALHALVFLGSSKSFPDGPPFSAKPSSREKILCPRNHVSLTTPLSILFSYGEHLLRKSIVLRSTCIFISKISPKNRLSGEGEGEGGACGCVIGAPALTHHEALLVIKNHDIGIEPDAQITLGPLQPDLLRRVPAAPPDHVLDAEVRVAPRALGPQDGQAEPHAADAAPGREEVAALRLCTLFPLLRLAARRLQLRRQQLQRRRAGRVVRDDGLDDAAGAILPQLRPQAVLVRLRTDGRAALVAGVAGAHPLRRQREVVEAGLSGDPDAVAARLAQQRDRLHRAQVHDVQRQLRG